MAGQVEAVLGGMKVRCFSHSKTLWGSLLLLLLLA